MDRIKVLKDIIHDHDPDYTAEASESDLDSFASEINQLYEPHSDDYCGICKREFLNGDTRYPLGGKYGSPLCPDCLNSQPISKPQPDQSSYNLDHDEWYEWFIGMLHRKPDIAEKNAIRHLVEARIEALIEFIMIFLKDAGYGSRVANIGWMQFQDKYNIPAGELSLVEELEIALKANPTSQEVKCPDCEGQGSTDLINPVYCLRCNHSGVINPTSEVEG